MSTKEPAPRLTCPVCRIVLIGRKRFRSHLERHIAAYEALKEPTS